MPPQATLKRAIPSFSVVLEDRTPFRWGMWFLLSFILVVVGRIQEVILALAPFRVGLITGGLAALAWVMAPGSFHEKLPYHIKQVKYIMTLLALAVLTLPIGVWPGHSFEFLTGSYWKVVLLHLLVIFWCRSVVDVRRLIWACCLGITVLVVVGVVTGDHASGRFTAGSQTYDSNDLALVLAMTLPLLAYLFSVSGFLKKLVLVGMIFSSFYGLMLSQSRGGFLAVLIVGALILWRSTLSLAEKIAMITITVLVFGILAGGEYWDRMATIWDPQTEYDRTAGGRTEVWKTGLMLLATRPWGVGIAGFETADGLSPGGKWSAPHNSFLQVGVELGVLGLFAFVLLLVRTVKELRRIQTIPTRVNSLHTNTPPLTLLPLASALEISLWGFVVGGFFLSQAYSGLLYIVLALSLACVRLARSARTSSL